LFGSLLISSCVRACAQFKKAVSFVGEGSILLSNTSITMEQSCFGLLTRIDHCLITIAAANLTLLDGSAIYGPNTLVTTGILVIDADSEISSSGMGLNPVQYSAADGVQGSGGGHAGSGALLTASWAACNLLAERAICCPSCRWHGLQWACQHWRCAV
jgi:hypothetical protein